MRNTRLYVDGFVFGIPDGELGNVADVVTDVMAHGKFGVVEVLDDNDRKLDLYLNGRRITTAVIDRGGRPSEIGSPGQDAEPSGIGAPGPAR